MFRKAYRVNYILYIIQRGRIGIVLALFNFKRKKQEKLIGKKNPFHGNRE